jgi:(3R)-3-[(carboxylmethyl)amino]fatty acid synthase
MNASTITPSVPDDPALRERVLSPYREHCQYLRSATVQAADGKVSAACEFSVGESYYIDSTGHFNAVEFNICYNQAAYYLIAQTVQHGLMPAFAGWTLADFWERQLSGVLIVEFNTTFQHQINPAAFHGELTFREAWQHAATATNPALVAIETTCKFWDDVDGRCRGRVLLAVTDPPVTAHR